MQQSIGPYNVQQEIGRGGMGVVYLARDTRLDRDVAIKALPDHLATDPLRLERFEREARTLAGLSHPNVAGIYGVEEQDGAKYLVLEFVDGETIADRLDRGPLDIDEAIELAMQIAAGVEAAHEAGIIHRDLKPANIKINSDGQVKVLDFGLARADDGGQSSRGGLDSPTMTSPQPQHSPTIEGAILGTAAYMSPEQARGRRVDKRTDIWSFGVVLFEMLVGASPFHGETASDSIGAVLHKNLDLDLLPPNTPANVRRVLGRCLERDKNQRYRDIGDVRIELEHDSGESHAAVNPARRSPFALIAIAAIIFALVGAGAMWLLKPIPKLTLMNLAIPVADRFESIDQLALSPDGETIAMIAKEHPTENGNAYHAVYIRNWSDENFRKLQGTDRATGSVVFSPSGKSLLIEIRDEVRPISEVRSIPIAGGPSTKVFEILQADAYSNIFCYISDDAIAVLSQDKSKLYRISTSGVVPETALPLSGFEDWNVRHLVQSALGSQTLIATLWNKKTRQTSLFRVDLGTGTKDLLLDDAARATVLSDGHIIFNRDNAIWMATFDIDNAKVTGPTKGIFSGISNFVMESTARRAVYLAQDNSENRVTVVAADASGRPVSTLVDVPGNLSVRCKIALSPDGQRLVFNYHGQKANHDLWIHDITSGLTRPLSSKNDALYHPNWTPDGRIAYHHVSTQQILFMDAVPGADPEPLLPGYANASIELSFSSDGRYVLTVTKYEQGESGIYLFDVSDGESGRPFYASPSSEGDAVFSPDGRWVAYKANGSGHYEIYLRPFDPESPESTPIFPVTKLGGQVPKWSPDGKTLYYFGIDKEKDTLFAVNIETDPEIKVSERRTISTDMAEVVDFIPMPDGTFIMLKSPDIAAGKAPDLRVIFNWEME